MLVPRVATIVDMHNVYSSLVRRTGEERKGVVGTYLRREAQLLARVESRVVNEADAVLAVSRSDRDHFHSLGGRHVHVHSQWCRLCALRPAASRRTTDQPLVLYVGSLSWQPNADAVKFLLRHVLPELKSKMPDVRIRVIGRGADDELIRMRDQPGVEILTNVDDVRPHLAQAHVLAVPLEAGGGSRLKILEAFAAGLPVVSTAVGAEGIDAEDGRHLLLAERPEFAAAISRLMRDATSAGTSPKMHAPWRRNATTGCRLAHRLRLSWSRYYATRRDAGRRTPHLVDRRCGRMMRMRLFRWPDSTFDRRSLSSRSIDCTRSTSGRRMRLHDIDATSASRARARRCAGVSASS